MDTHFHNLRCLQPNGKIRAESGYLSAGSTQKAVTWQRSASFSMQPTNASPQTQHSHWTVTLSTVSPGAKMACSKRPPHIQQCSEGQAECSRPSSLALPALAGGDKPGFSIGDGILGVITEGAAVRRSHAESPMPVPKLRGRRVHIQDAPHSCWPHADVKAIIDAARNGVLGGSIRVDCAATSKPHPGHRTVSSIKGVASERAGLAAADGVGPETGVAVTALPGIEALVIGPVPGEATAG